MCSPTLFFADIKKNWTLLLIFLAVLSMYMGVMVAMYDPNDMVAITAMLDLFPEDMMRMMGFSKIVTDLTSFIASWLYGLLMLGFPMVYCIILGNRLVVKMVDDSSFAYLLSSPNSRITLIFTQGMYALLSVMLLFAALFGFGIAISAAVFPNLLDVGAFFRLNVTTMLVNMVVMMISFFFSCLFNETKHSTLFGAGLPIAFLLMNMLGGASADAEILKKISIYGIYDPLELVQNGGMLGVNLLYIASIIVLLIASILVFNKKRLPL